MKKLLCFIIALAMILPLSFTVAFAAEAQKDIAMTIGGDETERNFTWYHSSDSGTLEISVANGNSLASDFISIPSSVSKTANGTTNIHRASVFGLEYDTKYAYRVRNGSDVSKTYVFTTDSYDSFNFIFVGDPQIGGSSNDTNDEGKWKNTLNTINQMFPNTNLLVSAGDQVERGNKNNQFSLFLSSDAIKSFALATSIGNHEETKSSSSTDSLYLYSEHFTLPNTLVTGQLEAKSAPGSNYYYTYNNTLFIHLNSNKLEYDQHKAFMEKAIALNPEATWKVVVMHYTLYGAGEYFEKDPIIERREAFAPMFEELGIDVVLSGHEHVYARSYIMNDSKPVSPNASATSVTDPDGILYLAGGSSTGSKLYEMLPDDKLPHVAKKIGKTATFTNIEVTANSFKLTTYNASTKAVLDTFEIKKTNTKAPVNPKNHEHTPSEWFVYNEANLYCDGIKVNRCLECGALADSKVIPSFITDPDNTNLALAKSYTISGNGKPHTKYCANLTDGAMAQVVSYDHHWFSFYYQPQYPNDINAPNGIGTITIDLEQFADISEVKVRLLDLKGDSGINGPKWMKVYLSNDGVNFGDAIDVTIPESEKNVAFYATAEVNESARYVKLEVALNGTFAFMNEVEVHGEKSVIPNPAGILGDVNNDGKIDQYDYVLVKRHHFDTRTLTEDEATRADANKDGKVDTFDYLLIARHYFGTYVIK